MKRMINLIFIIFLSTVTLVFAQQKLPKVSGDSVLGTITIGSEPHYPPFCFLDEKGNADGFSIELFKAAAKAAGLQVEIKIGFWERVMDDLIMGRIDALPLVGRTPEREDLFDFTLPYLSLRGAVFVRDETTDIRSLDDLKNSKIAVMKGDNAEEYVRRTQISKTIYTTDTFKDAFTRLAAGDYDAVVAQRLMGLYLLKKMGIQMIKPIDFQLPDFRQNFCFAVREGNKQLLQRLDEGLSIIIASQTFDEIRFKWFGPIFNEKTDYAAIFKIALYLTIPIFIIMSIISIIFLRRAVKKRTESLNAEISDHKKTLQDLKLNEQLLQVATSNLNGILYVLDTDLRYVLSKGSKLKDLGLRDNEIIGKTIYEFFQTEDPGHPSIRKHLNALSGQEEKLETKHGELFFSTTISPIRNSVGKITGIVGLTSDITELKWSEEELRKVKKELELRVAGKTGELQAKVLEMERFYHASVEREIRMKELWDEIQVLKNKNLSDEI